MEGHALIFFVAGLLLLIGGAELLVRGATRLSLYIGIPPLVIGLTVVAFGTSAPELAVSVQSALAGQANIALGNVLGSNIFNVLFILGASALITPLVVTRKLVRVEVPIMIGVSVLLGGMAWDERIGRVDGTLLFGGLLIYTVGSVLAGLRDRKVEEHGQRGALGRKDHAGRGLWVRSIGYVIVGLILLVFGARWLVEGAVSMARFLGLDELVIGLTIVSAGTSLPEVATSIVASLRGERDIAVGNVVGSNIFNILGVLGLSSLMGPQGISVSPAVMRFDIPVMIAVAAACLPIFFTEKRISRWEGSLFLGYYGAYTLYLLLRGVHHRTLPVFNTIMLAFVIPLTVITVFVIALRALRSRRAGSPSG
ncbi:MAG: calcium/sodium antiporter [bacterium]|nr:MAG: calcium/sodium antiporter [bacterium]